MHSARLADPVDPTTKALAQITAKRRKTEADLAEIARLEWRGGLWIHQGQPCIPAEAVEAALVAAAGTRRQGRRARAGLMCPAHSKLIYPGPSELDELWADSRFRLRVPVRVLQARVMRTRPRFPEWKAEVVIQFLPTLLNERHVRDMLLIAGDQIGLGDWRPKYGRFRVERVEESAAAA